MDYGAVSDVPRGSHPITRGDSIRSTNSTLTDSSLNDPASPHNQYAHITASDLDPGKPYTTNTGSLARTDSFRSQHDMSHSVPNSPGLPRRGSLCMSDMDLNSMSAGAGAGAAGLSSSWAAGDPTVVAPGGAAGSLAIPPGLVTFDSSKLYSVLGRMAEHLKRQAKEIEELKLKMLNQKVQVRKEETAVTGDVTLRLVALEERLEQVVAAGAAAEARHAAALEDVKGRTADIVSLRVEPMVEKMAKLDKNLGVHHGLIQGCYDKLDKTVSPEGIIGFALASDLARLEEECTTYARQSSFERLEEQVEEKVDRNKLAILRSELEYATDENQQQHEKLVETVNKNIKRLTNTDTRITMIDDNVSNVRAQVERDFPRVRDSVDEVHALFATLSEAVETKAVQKDVEQMWEEVERFASRDALDALQISINDSVRTMESAVDHNTQNLQSKLAELDQYERKLGTKASKVDLTQLQFKINEACVTKHELSSSLKPLIVKHDQFLGKMVDLDRAVGRKADMQTTLEHRDHIQELYHLLQEVQVQVGSETTTAAGGGPAGGSGGIGGMASSGLNSMTPAGSTATAGGEGSLGSGSGNATPGESKSAGANAGANAAASAPPSAASAAATAEQSRDLAALKEKMAQVHAKLKEIHEIIIGNKGALAAANQHPNHHLWQQMIAFRKLFVLSAEDGHGELVAPDGTTAGGGVGGVPPGQKHIFKTDMEKKRWELEEKQRWLVETRGVGVGRKTPTPPIGARNGGGSAGASPGGQRKRSVQPSTAGASSFSSAPITPSEVKLGGDLPQLPAGVSLLA